MAVASSSSAASADKVQICIVQGDAFVWSPTWIARLRCEYGIVGMLVGSLPLIPQQNVFLGVPLQLFEEEVVYLVRKGAAILVDDATAHADMQATMNGDALRAWHEERQSVIAANKLRIVEQSRASREQWEKHIAGTDKATEKRRERERRKQERREEDMQAAREEGDDGDESMFSVEKEQESAVQNVSHPITIATSSLELPWRVVRTNENAFESLSEAAKHGLWRYPTTSSERAKCAVFENLRERGYFMGKGLRFGGDFVVYPGDPLRYHSHFTATVQESPQTSISAQELVAAGRLGTAVKKAHLLCSVSANDEMDDDVYWQDRLDGKHDDAEHVWGDVTYFSMTWAGFGT